MKSSSDMELTKVRGIERVAQKIYSKLCVCLQYSSSSEETEKGLETGIRVREKIRFLLKADKSTEIILGKKTPVM